MQDAFGVDRSDISKGMNAVKVCERCGGKIDMKTGKCTECGMQSVSKGFSPAQIETLYNAGGAFRARAYAAQSGKARVTGKTVENERRFGQRQRENSTSKFPRGTQNKARSTGYRNEYVAPQGTRGSKFDSMAPERRVFVNPNSDAAWKLRQAKARGATFGANNPANRGFKPKRSMASVKSRVRAKLGMKSY